MEKLIIYQVFTRLFGANANKNVSNGTKKENGCGKMADFTGAALAEIKKLGATHIWYTGLIEHATKSDYTQYGIEKDHPAVVKGMAGSPYAIKDYYDIDPDLATKVPERMKEFEKLVMRTHKADLKMIIDFVPNHVARQYHSDAKPEGVRDLGEDDDTTEAFHPDNNFYYMPCTQFSPNFSLHDEEMGDYVEMPAKVTGNDCFTPWVSQNDWYETVKLNYGVDYQGTRQLIFCPSTPNTWLKMRDILLFWASKGIDGFRCDMAEMVPCDFWGWVIPQVKAKYPDIIRPFYQEKNLYSQHIDIYQVVFYPNARGKYVAFCEGDDYWTDPTKLQRQVDYLEEHPDYSACVHNTVLHFCEDGHNELLLDRYEGGVGFEHIVPGMYYIDRCMSVYRINSNASAWSSGVDRQYDKLRRFIIGKVEMLRAFRPHAPEEVQVLVDRTILEREFELMYIEGRDSEQRKPPYSKLLKAMPLGYRLKNWVKCSFPGVQRVYRRMRGYDS